MRYQVYPIDKLRARDVEDLLNRIDAQAAMLPGEVAVTPASTFSGGAMLIVKWEVECPTIEVPDPAGGRPTRQIHRVDFPTSS